MILETMTPDEIHNNIFDEFQMILSKQIAKWGKSYDKLRHKNRIDKKMTYSKIVEYVAPSKNNWIFIFSKAPSDISYKGFESITFCSLIYYFNEIGIRVFKIIPSNDGAGVNGLSVFNGHLFTRYNDRMNLGIVKPVDKVKHFFINNGYIYSQYYPDKEKRNMIGICREGILLGELQNNGKWTVYNTFITKDMKSDNQDILERDLMNRLQSDIEDAIKKANFDKDSYFYMANAYKGIF